MAASVAAGKGGTEKYLRITVHGRQHWEEMSYWLPWPEDLLPSPDTFVDYGRVLGAPSPNSVRVAQRTPEQADCWGMLHQLLYEGASPSKTSRIWTGSDYGESWREVLLRAVKARGGGFLLNKGQRDETSSPYEHVPAVARPGCPAIHGTVDFCE